jgi:hypothetical protein
MAQSFFERKKHLFISSETTGLDVTDKNGKLHRLQFENCICSFDEDEIADAIRKHPHFGWRFFEDKKDRQIENKFSEAEKQDLATALAGMSINLLRSMCKEQNLMDGDWKKISGAKKDELVLYMVKHKDKLGHYATLGH